MNALCVISSRYESSRFPGKPLALINGREMILWVAENCKKAVGIKNVLIATDDQRIMDCAINAGYNSVIIDSSRCHNCTDATAEAVRFLDYNIIIDVQGDEPLISSDDIKEIIKFKQIKHDHIINAYGYEKEGENKNTIKVETYGNANDDLIVMSRLPIPAGARIFKRQVCVYGFYKEQLLRYYGYGKSKSQHEKFEDIHIFRCIDNRQPVFMVKLKGKYQSVDVPEDIQKVEDIINE